MLGRLGILIGLWSAFGCPAVPVLDEVVSLDRAAFAQPPGGGGRRGGPGRGSDFYGALREAHQLAPQREILDLLHHQVVRDDLGIDEELSSEFQKLTFEAIDKIRKLGRREPNRAPFERRVAD